MEKMRVVNVEEEKVNILSDAISKFIHSVDDESIEGAFVIPCCANGGVRMMFLEFVHSGNISDKIFEADKSYLETVSMLTGVNVKIEAIDYSWYSNPNGFEIKTFPVRGMLKSGSIVYDKKGRLKALRKKYMSDDSIKNFDGAVRIEPPVQYKLTV